jgi:hypothetical protein
MNILKIKKSEEKKEDIHNVKNLNKLLNVSKDIKKEYEQGIFEGKFDNTHIIGDIHGDFFTFKRCLELTQCVSFDDIIYDNVPNNVLLNKFYRVGNEFTRSTKGTGLGLYLCKKIAEFHQSQLLISENHPQGTIFSFKAMF